MHSDASGRVRMRSDAFGKFSFFSEQTVRTFWFLHLWKGFWNQFCCILGSNLLAKFLPSTVASFLSEKFKWPYVYGRTADTTVRPYGGTAV